MFGRWLSYIRITILLRLSTLTTNGRQLIVVVVSIEVLSVVLGMVKVVRLLIVGIHLHLSVSLVVGVVVVESWRLALATWFLVLWNLERRLFLVYHLAISRC